MEFHELDQRSRDVFDLIVEMTLGEGQPVGSRTLQRGLDKYNVSPATIRNIMQDLEYEGLLYSPHTSAGRLPTDKGLRFYVDGIMQSQAAKPMEEELRNSIEQAFHGDNEVQTVGRVYNRVSTVLSNISETVSFVAAPSKVFSPIKQAHFVRVEPEKVMVVLVHADNNIENRMMPVPTDLPQSALEKVSNYINHHIAGMTLEKARQSLLQEIEANQSEIDAISKDLIDQGLAISTEDRGEPVLIVKGRSELVGDLSVGEKAEQIRAILDQMEDRQVTADMLLKTTQAEGVQLFIGDENPVFKSTHFSTVLSPYRDADNKLIGVVGVVGPKHMRYGQIIPLVDYTSRIVEKLVYGR